MGSMTIRPLQFRRDCLEKGASKRCGAIAQLGERLNGIQEVSGSIPLSSTTPESRTRFSGFFILLHVLTLLFLGIGCPDSPTETDPNSPMHASLNDAGPQRHGDGGIDHSTSSTGNDGGPLETITDAGFLLPAPCAPGNTWNEDIESSNDLQSEDGGILPICIDAAVKIKESSLREIRFENLEYISGDLVLYKNHLAETIAFPNLMHVEGEIYIGLNTNLKTISFPALKTSGRFIFQSNENLERLEGFGILEETKDIIIQQMDALTHIELPQLIATDGFLSIAHNPLLENIILPELFRSNSSIQIFSNAHLPSIELPALSHVNTDFRIEYNNLLISFELPSINHVGGDLTFARNYALNGCLVDDWVEELQNNNVINGSIDIAENNSEEECP